MPRHGEEPSARQLRERLDRVTAMFCETCRRIDADDRPYLRGAAIPWWERHKRLDNQRAVRQAASAADAAAKQAAIAKLTAEERRVLGV